MENPFAPQPRKRHESPPAYNNFQRELEYKMKQRKKQGLTTDVTPSESGQESADELGSDNDLMANFNMTRGKSRSPSPRKSPLAEINGISSYDKKKEIIFGNKSHALSDEEDSDDGHGYGENSMLRTMKKPMNLKDMMKSGKKQSPKQNKHSFREEDEVDAAVSNRPYYDRKQQKPWEPPSFKKDSLLENDDEQLMLDLNKTKQRTKSPKPGRKTPSDLDSITEERELYMDDEEALTPKPASRRTGPVPKPRSYSSTEVKGKPKSKSPTTDLFGSSKYRSKSPGGEKESKYLSKSKKSPETERKQSIFDHLTGSPEDKKKKGLKGSKDDKGKNKYLNKEDSDDSLGEEFGRRDAVSRKSKYDQGSPLDRFSTDKNRKSPYGKDRKSPFEKDRKSPFEREKDRRSPFEKDRDRKSPFEKDRKVGYDKDRLSPYDTRNRRSPFDDDDRRASPLSVMDERKMKDSNPYADRPFGDSLADYRKQKEQDYRKEKDRYDREDDRSHKDNNKRSKDYNPFSEDSKSRYDHDDRNGRRDDRYDPRDDRDYRDRDHRSYREDEYDPYGRKDQRDHRDHDLDSRYDQRDDRYGDKHGRKSPHRNERDDDRKSPYGDRKSPFGDRKSPFSSYKKSYDDTDNRKRVGFDGPPTLKKGERDYRDQHDDYDRKPRLRRDEDNFDRYGRRSRGDEDFDDRQSRPKNRDRNKGPERESSLCRDVEADPGPMRKPDTEEEEKIKKREVKSHTKQSRLLDQVIDSVKEEQHKFRPVDPDKNKDDKEDKRRSLSARHKPQPRYAKPVIESFPTSRPSSAIDANNSTSLRDAAFLEWYNERKVKAKKEKEEKLKKEKEEEKKKKKEEVDKKLESTASYNAWMEKKKEESIEIQRKQRRQQLKKEEKEMEKFDKKKDSELVFRKWKENKEVGIQEKVWEEKHKERKKKEEEEQAKREKEKDAQRAFKGWSEKKTEVLKEQSYEKQREIAKQKREEKRKQADREKEASKSYRKWMEKKSDQKHQDRKTMKTRQLQEYAEPRPAWSPASRTVPFGR